MSFSEVIPFGGPGTPTTSWPSLGPPPPPKMITSATTTAATAPTAIARRSFGGRGGGGGGGGSGSGSGPGSRTGSGIGCGSVTATGSGSVTATGSRSATATGSGSATGFGTGSGSGTLTGSGSGTGTAAGSSPSTWWRPVAVVWTCMPSPVAASTVTVIDSSFATDSQVKTVFSPESSSVESHAGTLPEARGLTSKSEGRPVFSTYSDQVIGVPAIASAGCDSRLADSEGPSVRAFSGGRSKSRPSGDRMNSTGVPHSTSLPDA